MRLHRLAVTAFGPFADTVDVDFDEYGRDGLFLLWGPTGAGKTTLLDAVVYALYGCVPGARGEEKRLRSDHADAVTRTEVRCELTLGSERLRIIRRPEQQRPKRRGTGWTTEHAALSVQRWLGEAWEPVSTRIDEGSEHLRRRLGLSAEQFCQVVLLPQGDFARFLRAEPEDRTRLLRTLFDVGRFTRAEDWLAERRAAAREQLQATTAGIATLLARLAQSADVDIPEDLAPEMVGAAPGVSVLPWVEQLRVAAGERLAGATVLAEESATALAGASADLTAARALAERHARRARAEQELSRLLAEGEALAPLAAERGGGRRAEPLRDVLTAARAARNEEEAIHRELAAAHDAWAATGEELPATPQVVRALREEAAAARALLPEVERLARLRSRMSVLDGEMEQLQDRCEQQRADVAAWPARLAAQEEQVARAQDAAARLPGLDAACAAACTALRAAQEAERLEDAVIRARTDTAESTEAWLDAKERWLELRRHRLDGMSAELAADLRDGAACPVCGSVGHLAPARYDGPRVTADDEQAARDAADAAERRATAARISLEDGERELAVLRARAGAGTAAELSAAVEDCDAQRAAAADVAGTLEQVRRASRELAEARDQAAVRLAADESALGARRAERDTLTAAAVELEDRLRAARRDSADLEERIRRLDRAAHRGEALVLAEAEAARSTELAAAAEALAAERVAAAGFSGVPDAAAALLEPGRLAELDRRLDGHERELAVVRAQLADPDLARLGEPPDLADLDGRLAELTRCREQAVAELDDARRRAAVLDRLAGEVAAAQLKLDQVRDRAEQVGGLADLVSGRGANTLRMRLESFVLAARLEQVAEVAGQRLRHMSGGRYTFLHSDAQARHGARGGLGLDVFDEYTGVRRPTKTLSGGESFMASLALALGLADVVTAETGGVRIDTLFVDEGFGTLDAQSLDAVMTVLDELRRGGRTVGVISHVEELRARIPAALEVVAGRNGSRLAG